MVAHVLVPVDESDLADAALTHTFEHHPDAVVTVLHVIDPAELVAYGGMEGGAMINYDEIQSQQEERAEELFRDARRRAEEHGIELETALVTGRPAHSILEFVDENDIDHVVIGSHGRTGAKRVLLGSVAETVIRRSRVPVTVVR